MIVLRELNTLKGKEMFLKLEYELLECKKLSQEAKIIISYIAGLDATGRKFWGYANFFEKWGIAEHKAAMILGKLEQEGLIYKSSDNQISFAGKETLKIYLERWK